MGMIGLDTCFLIDFFNGDPGARTIIEQSSDVCICEHAIYEFLRGKITTEQESNFYEFISQTRSFMFDRKAAVHAAKLYRQAQRQGNTLDGPDLLIAVTYMVNGVSTIITRNNKHFAGIPGITVRSY